MAFVRCTVLVLFVLVISLASVQGQAVHSQQDVREPVADSHVYVGSKQGRDETNWGAYQGLAAGRHATDGERRMYILFDLTGVSLDPNGQAVLRLYHYHTSGSPALTLGIHEVTAPWTEGKGAGTPDPTAGVTGARQPVCATTPSATLAPGDGMNKHVEVDVTALVRGWLAGRPNHGLVIAPIARSDADAKESVYGFCSREYADKDRRPALILRPTAVARSKEAGGTAQERNKDLDGPSDVDVMSQEAYRKYIAAYNKLTSLMAAGKGDTPEAKQAHAEYLKARAEYEKVPPAPLKSH